MSLSSTGVNAAAATGLTIIPAAKGYSGNPSLCAADVTIKEQRKLVLAVRETPLSPIYLENMLKLSRIPGVFLIPPVLTYYYSPKSIEDMGRQISGRLLQLFGIITEGVKRWK